jgi:hypothetical protein
MSPLAHCPRVLTAAQVEQLNRFFEEDTVTIGDRIQYINLAPPDFVAPPRYGRIVERMGTTVLRVEWEDGFGPQTIEQHRIKLA